MMKLCSDVLNTLQGKTLVTAESLTGGGIGAALTAAPGSSAVYKGGIISYTNQVKHALLNVDTVLLERDGAVSASVTQAMALGARNALSADVAVSVTGLAGPGGDDYGNSVGTVYIGYSDCVRCISREYHFTGNRAEIRKKACSEALMLILTFNV